MIVSKIDWDRPGKSQARDAMIFYMRSRGLQFIPKNKQFWTFAGNFLNSGGEAVAPEPDHFIKQQFMTADQYRGVDIDKDVFKRNSLLCPKYKMYHGDFVDIIHLEQQKGLFNPAVLHIDTMHRASLGVNIFMKTLDLIGYCHFDAYCFLNIVLKDVRDSKSIDECVHDVKTKITNHQLYPSVAEHFSGIEEVYRYTSPKKRYTMVTVVAT